jgi:hypothetical protein
VVFCRPTVRQGLMLSSPLSTTACRSRPLWEISIFCPKNQPFSYRHFFLWRYQPFSADLKCTFSYGLSGPAHVPQRFLPGTTIRSPPILPKIDKTVFLDS